MPPQTMQAMVLERAGEPLRRPSCRCPRRGRTRSSSRSRRAGCAAPICISSTASFSSPKLPLVLGHEIVGHVEALGDGVEGFASGERVGVPWLGYTDGTCSYCRAGQENLCDHPRFTGYQIDGGYAAIHRGRRALLLSDSRRL